jgi:microcystin degradation protein MlrC
MRGMKIFVAGFQHETNTFAPSPADWAAFNAGSAFPAFTRGPAMLDALAPTSLPMGGFIRAARAAGHVLVPSAWAGASPSARITADAFERVASSIVDDARQGGFDAVYLDLHGAAVAENADDAEGELLERLRAVVGAEMPLAASLDLHANVTERMLRLADALTPFRTYPHVDMAVTAGRALSMLSTIAHAPMRPRCAMHAKRLPFLLPLNAQCTLLEPAASIIALQERLESAHGVTLGFTMGFPAADFAECGPMVFGHGAQREGVVHAVEALHAEVLARRADWRLDLLDAREVVDEALALAESASAPIVIADTQDNPGAGGDSNTTGLLQALLAAGAGHRHPGRVALGLLHDPDAAGAACAAGIGASVELTLGRSVRCFDGRASEAPVRARCSVRAVSDGAVPLHGPMTAGGTVQLGASACVEIDGVLVLLVSGKCQMLDLDLYRFLGVEPATMKLLVVKSSVHFRAAFAPIASHILVAKAPGPMAADPADLPWRHLPAGMARRP